MFQQYVSFIHNISYLRWKHAKNTNNLILLVFFSILKYAKPGCMEMTVLRSVETASVPLLVITYLEVVISDVLQDGKIHPCAMKVQ